MNPATNPDERDNEVAAPVSNYEGSLQQPVDDTTQPSESTMQAVEGVDSTPNTTVVNDSTSVSPAEPALDQPQVTAETSPVTPVVSNIAAEPVQVQPTAQPTTTDEPAQSEPQPSVDASTPGVAPVVAAAPSQLQSAPKKSNKVVMILLVGVLVLVAVAVVVFALQAL